MAQPHDLPMTKLPALQREMRKGAPRPPPKWWWWDKGTGRLGIETGGERPELGKRGVGTVDFKCRR
jgi:hypothetical protein